MQWQSWQYDWKYKGESVKLSHQHYSLACYDVVDRFECHQHLKMVTVIKSPTEWCHHHHCQLVTKIFIQKIKILTLLQNLQIKVNNLKSGGKDYFCDYCGKEWISSKRVRYIDVSDGCWRRNVLVTTKRFWWRFWQFWSLSQTCHQHWNSVNNIPKSSPTSRFMLVTVKNARNSSKDFYNKILNE